MSKTKSEQIIIIAVDGSADEIKTIAKAITNFKKGDNFLCFSNSRLKKIAETEKFLVLNLERI